MRYQDRRGRVRYANAAVPRLPARLAQLVSTVVGLRDDVPPHHVPLRCLPHPLLCSAARWRTPPRHPLAI